MKLPATLLLLASGMPFFHAHAQTLAITKLPTPVTIFENGSATFSATFTPDDPGGSQGYRYTWTRNGALYSSERSILAPNQLANNGDKFQLEIFSPYGTLFTDVATLTVLSNPAVLTQPKAQTVLAGSSVTFSFSATGSSTSGPLSYQWYKLPYGGSTSIPYPGATTPSLTIPSATTADNKATIFAKITNSNKTITTYPVVLKVYKNPVFSDTALSQGVLINKAANIKLPAATDPDGTALTYTLSDTSPNNLPTGLTFNSSTLTITGTPTVENERKTLILTAANANGGKASQTFILSTWNPATYPTPALDLGFWNDGQCRQLRNNCYNYAMNYNGQDWAQPGYTGKGDISLEEVNSYGTADTPIENKWGLCITSRVTNYDTLRTADLAYKNILNVDGKTLVALGTNDHDFHWYRRYMDTNGNFTWSNKHDNDPVIIDTTNFNDGYTFYGFFWAQLTKTQGVGIPVQGNPNYYQDIDCTGNKLSTSASTTLTASNTISASIMTTSSISEDPKMYAEIQIFSGRPHPKFEIQGTSFAISLSDSIDRLPSASKPIPSAVAPGYLFYKGIKVTNLPLSDSKAKSVIVRGHYIYILDSTSTTLSDNGSIIDVKYDKNGDVSFTILSEAKYRGLIDTSLLNKLQDTEEYRFKELYK